MGLESTLYPNGLNANWPMGTDPKSQGDDHIRLLKAVLKDVFPGGWDDADILNLMKRFRATQAPGQATGSGGAADLTNSLAKLGQTAHFGATSGIVFLDGWANVSKTTSANTVSIDVRIYDVTAGAMMVTDNFADHGQPASGEAAYAAYTPHFSGLIAGMTVGHEYRAELWAMKSVTEGPLQVVRWKASVFCI